MTPSELMDLLYGGNPYEGFSAEGMDCDLQGWGSSHPVFSFMIEALRPETIIEVGAWKGGSTVHMAKLLQQHDIPGAVLSVDTWLGSEEHFRRREFLPRRNGMPTLYHQFLANMIHSGVTDRVIPVPQTSQAAARVLERAGIRADLIYLDASHDFQDVLRDLFLYWPLLKEGGCLIGDDYHWLWPGVAHAAREFAQAVQQPLFLWTTKFLVGKACRLQVPDAIRAPNPRHLYWDSHSDQYVWK